MQLLLNFVCCLAFNEVFAAIAGASELGQGALPDLCILAAGAVLIQALVFVHASGTLMAMLTRRHLITALQHRHPLFLSILMRGCCFDAHYHHCGTDLACRSGVWQRAHREVLRPDRLADLHLAHRSLGSPPRYVWPGGSMEVLRH